MYSETDIDRIVTTVAKKLEVSTSAFLLGSFLVREGTQPNR